MTHEFVEEHPQQLQPQSCIACRVTADSVFPHCLLSHDPMQPLLRSGQLVSYPHCHMIILVPIWTVKRSLRMSRSWPSLSLFGSSPTNTVSYRQRTTGNERSLEAKSTRSVVHLVTLIIMHACHTVVCRLGLQQRGIHTNELINPMLSQGQNSLMILMSVEK